MDHQYQVKFRLGQVQVRFSFRYMIRFIYFFCLCLPLFKANFHPCALFGQEKLSLSKIRLMMSSTFVVLNPGSLLKHKQIGTQHSSIDIDFPNFQLNYWLEYRSALIQGAIYTSFPCSVGFVGIKRSMSQTRQNVTYQTRIYSNSNLPFFATLSTSCPSTCLLYTSPSPRD